MDIRLCKKIKKFIVFNKQETSDSERFLVVFKHGVSELFEFRDDKLYILETEKVREHDCEITGYDYNAKLNLLVTADERGTIRIWNYDKKLLREINFPTRIDNIVFLNQ